MKFPPVPINKTFIEAEANIFNRAGCKETVKRQNDNVIAGKKMEVGKDESDWFTSICSGHSVSGDL